MGLTPITPGTIAVAGGVEKFPVELNTVLVKGIIIWFTKIK